MPKPNGEEARALEALTVTEGWRLVASRLNESLQSCKEELEGPEVGERRSDFLRGQIAAFRFALQSPSRMKSAANPEIL
jgi:hypothetical protein